MRGQVGIRSTMRVPVCVGGEGGKAVRTRVTALVCTFQLAFSISFFHFHVFLFSIFLLVVILFRLCACLSVCVYACV